MSDLTQSTVLILIIAYHQDFLFNYGGEIGDYQFFWCPKLIGSYTFNMLPTKKIIYNNEWIIDRYLLIRNFRTQGSSEGMTKINHPANWRSEEIRSFQHNLIILSIFWCQPISTSTAQAEKLTWVAHLLLLFLCFLSVSLIPGRVTLCWWGSKRVNDSKRKWIIQKLCHMM